MARKKKNVLARTHKNMQNKHSLSLRLFFRYNLTWRTVKVAFLKWLINYRSELRLKSCNNTLTKSQRMREIEQVSEVDLKMEVVKKCTMWMTLREIIESENEVFRPFVEESYLFGVLIHSSSHIGIVSIYIRCNLWHGYKQP